MHFIKLLIIIYLHGKEMQSKLGLLTTFNWSNFYIICTFGIMCTQSNYFMFLLNLFCSKIYIKTIEFNNKGKLRFFALLALKQIYKKHRFILRLHEHHVCRIRRKNHVKIKELIIKDMFWKNERTIFNKVSSDCER